MDSWWLSGDTSCVLCESLVDLSALCRTDIHVQRFIYPRIAQSFQARHALRTHQKELLKKLTASIEQTKAEQSASFALLPAPEPHKEDSTYVGYKTLDDILASAKDPNSVPDVTLLRCAIQEVVASKQPVTAAAIFSSLESKMPWSNTEQADQIQVS